MALEENTSPASATWATTVTPKPCARARPPQRLGIAGAAFAEAEIVADHHVAHAEPLHQHALDERLGRQAARAASKRTTTATSSPSASSSASLRGSGVRRKCGLSGWKNSRGCGSKTMAPAGAAVPPRLADGRRDQRLVAPVHAVEVADRQHAAAGRGRNIIGTMDNDHGWSGWSGARARIASDCLTSPRSAVAAEACILLWLTCVEWISVPAWKAKRFRREAPPSRTISPGSHERKAGSQPQCDLRHPTYVWQQKAARQ